MKEEVWQAFIRQGVKKEGRGSKRSTLKAESLKLAGKTGMSDITNVLKSEKEKRLLLPPNVSLNSGSSA